jgi:hypothetical protein
MATSGPAPKGTQRRAQRVFQQAVQRLFPDVRIGGERCALQQGHFIERVAVPGALAKKPEDRHRRRRHQPQRRRPTPQVIFDPRGVALSQAKGERSRRNDDQRASAPAQNWWDKGQKRKRPPTFPSPRRAARGEQQQRASQRRDHWNRRPGHIIFITARLHFVRNCVHSPHRQVWLILCACATVSFQCAVGEQTTCPHTGSNSAAEHSSTTRRRRQLPPARSRIDKGVFKIDNPEVRLLREVELRRSASLTDFELHPIDKIEQTKHCDAFGYSDDN